MVITISILHGCSNATCPCPSSSDVSRPRASSFDTSCPSGYRQSARARASSSATQPMRHADTTHVRRQFASRRGVERAPSKVPRPITASRCARQTSLTPWRPSTRCRTSVQPSTLPLHWHCPASPWERNTCPLWGEVTSLVHTWQVNRSPRAAGTDQRSASSRTSRAHFEPAAALDRLRLLSVGAPRAQASSRAAMRPSRHADTAPARRYLPDVATPHALPAKTQGP